MRKKRIFSQSSFTLMEVLLAMTLLVVGVVSIVKVMSSGLSADSSVEGQTIALKLAQEKMEEVKNVSSALGTTQLDAIHSMTLSGTFSSPYTAYSYSIGLTDPYNSQTGTAQVVVTVSWTSKGKSRSVVLTTLIADTTPAFGGEYSNGPSGGGGAAYGASCNVGGDCASGICSATCANQCTNGDWGDTCCDNIDCPTSGFCDNWDGQCTDGTSGQPCYYNLDCASVSCNGSNLCD